MMKIPIIPTLAFLPVVHDQRRAKKDNHDDPAELDE